MIKTVFKSLIKIIMLLCIGFVMALYMSKVLRPDRLDINNDTKRKVLEFYKLEKDTADILLIGSSHIYYGVNPGIIYEETGLNSYIRGGECQPIEVSYYMLKEALNSQKPKLVIYDAFGIGESVEACKTDGIYRVNLENMKTNSIKIEAYKDVFNEESVIKDIFDVSLYHNRWSEVPLDKWINDDIDLNAFGYTYGNNFSDEIVKIESLLDLSIEIDKTKLEYLNKIKDLCKENNIEFLLIKTPYYIEDTDAGIFETLNKWALDNNIPFINFNKIKEDINYNFNVDGDIWHSNVKGSIKITNYLSKYINENYKFEKGKTTYEDLYHNIVIKTKNLAYSNEYNLEKLIDYTKYKDQILLISYNYFPNSLMKPDEKQLLETIGFDFKNNPDKKMIAKVIDGNIVESYYSDEYFNQTFKIENHEYFVETNGFVQKDGVGINIANNYACVTIVDKTTGELIDTYCLDTEGGLLVHRDMLVK